MLSAKAPGGSKACALTGHRVDRNRKFRRLGPGTQSKAPHERTWAHAFIMPRGDYYKTPWTQYLLLPLVIVLLVLLVTPCPL